MLCVFIGLAKPSDTVNHEQLMNVLPDIGGRGDFQNLLNIYLTHREQYVNVKEVISDKLIVECKVLQGTVLRPFEYRDNINL